MWRPQADHASARGWRVIVPDLRGYGETTVVPGATTLETFARDIAALLDHLGIDYGATLAGVTVPTCVVVGTDDDFTPVAEAERMHEQIPGSSLVVIEGTGHLPNFERPAGVDAVLDALLRSVVAPG
jgi:pimeloyl-ACP methyl ester carboxylesterase